MSYMSTLFDAMSTPHAPVAPVARLALRPYQEDAVASIEERFAEHRSALLVLPTGAGKTVCFAELIRRRSEGRAMVLAHREELVEQAARKIRDVTGEQVAIEMAEQWSPEFGSSRPRIVVSTIQTQISGQTKRYMRFKPADFSTIIVDEAHHAVAATYLEVLAHYSQSPKARLLGVTATPDRTDEEALGQVFASVAYEYQIHEAIEDGYLVPIDQAMIACGALDLSGVGTRLGDFNQEQLGKIIEDERIVHEMAYPTIRETGDTKTIVFCASVAQADKFTEVLNRHKPQCAEIVTGKTPRDVRRDMFRRYSDGRFQYLVNVGVATEGFDEPGIEHVVIARPTKSRSLYAQMVGRGTRPLPGTIERAADADERREAIAQSQKPRLSVLDFRGNAGKHKLVSVVDILGGEYPDDIVELARQKMEEAAKAGDGKRCKPIDATEALKEAEEYLAKKRDEQAKKAAIRVGVDYAKTSVSPFDVLDIKPYREATYERGRKPTENMVAALVRAKIPGADKMSFAAARATLQAIDQRRSAGLCTIPQMLRLARCGKDAREWSFERASSAMSYLATHGWRSLDGWIDPVEAR